jgi:NAD(P)-dependent dehydrogenase (short-subunit alcohol dehydrogenase family)
MASPWDRQALAGKAGLVTGGASGIGRAAVQLLVAAGASVAVADLDQDGGMATVEACEGPGTAYFAQTDITDPDSVSELVASVVDRFGQLDFAHNNAAITHAGVPLAEVDDDLWKQVLDVDLTGTFYCMRAEINAMLATGGGSIVNTASALGLVANAGQPVYVAAKHGVVGLTRAAAMDYSAKGIRVNALCPGVIETQMFKDLSAEDPALGAELEGLHPIGRLGRPEEIADALLWLVSDASSFVTGQAIPVDGAYTTQ